ncbi:MAG: hypothetical protein IJE70_02890 [Oscillospiraceae bacterium]|nr:hypothetical protein [Oscillospiraceae bacterium]
MNNYNNNYNKSTEVTYQTPNGQNAKGYIINGKTYKDPTGTQRVDIGSTVPTAGGTFTLTANGGVKTPTSIADDIRKGYDNSLSHLGASRDASISGITAGVERKQNTINQQRQQAQANYVDQNRNAYNAYLRASNPYGVAEEQRARLGLSNSGYSETSKMQLGGNYQQAINNNRLALDQYLQELDTAYRDAQFEGDIQRANAIANYEQLVYQHGIAAAEAIANQQNFAYNAGMDANEALWKRQQYEDQRAFDREQAAWNRQTDNRDFALKMANAGFSASDIASVLGISEADLWRIVGG